MSENYSFVFMSKPSELYGYKEVFSKNGSYKEMNKLEWTHFKNISKEPLTCLTKTRRAEIAAIYATMPVPIQICGSKVPACQSLDTLTDTDHRGKGLFVNVAKKVYEKAKSKNFAFVYGFPNGNSVHGFTKKLNWKLLDPVPFLFKPLRSGYFLKKLLGSGIGGLLDFKITYTKKIKLAQGECIKPIVKFGEDTDMIWEAFSKDIKVSVNRDSKYLNWRYFEKPGENYTVMGFYRSNNLRGLLVYCSKEKHGGSVGYVMEYIAFPEDTEAGEALFQYALNDFISQGSDVVLAWCFDFSPNYAVHKNKGFRRLPERIRPIELHFGYANFNTDEKILSTRENWYLSYSDSDTV